MLGTWVCFGALPWFCCKQKVPFAKTNPVQLMTTCQCLGVSAEQSNSASHQPERLPLEGAQRMCRYAWELLNAFGTLKNKNKDYRLKISSVFIQKGEALELEKENEAAMSLINITVSC